MVIDPGPKTDTVVRLDDGRTLGYAEWGDLNGKPVLLFHGSPGSRLLCPDAQITSDCAVRLISVDRPGYGNSDSKRGRWLLEWADDVRQLADQVGIDEFAVLGWSGGGPHALACAARLADRVSSVGLMASPGPTEKVPGVLENDLQRRMVYDGAVQDREGTTGAIVAFMEPVDGNDGRRWMDNLRSQFPNAAFLDGGKWEKNLIDHVVEGMRPGGEGRAEDGVANWGPWGFDVGEVAQPVFAWYGGRDANLPREHFDYLSTTIPACKPFFNTDDAHDCIYPRWREILDTVIAA